MDAGNMVRVRFNTDCTRCGSLASITPICKQVGVRVAMMARFQDGESEFMYYKNHYRVACMLCDDDSGTGPQRWCALAPRANAQQ